jgi:cell division inhibitor SepF
MAGTMRKAGVWLGLLENTDQYDEYYDDELDEATERRAATDARQERAPVTSIESRRRSEPTGAGQTGTELAKITTLHPRTYNEARTIGEHFRDGVPVIMNLTDMDDADAKRLVDFSAGLVFAVRGTIERVTAKVFLLSPPNVTVAAEERERITSGAFFNQS